MNRPRNTVSRALSTALTAVLTTALATALTVTAVTAVGAGTSHQSAPRLDADRIVPVAAKTKPFVLVQQNTDESRAAFDDAISRAVTGGADVITLQEVCESWLSGVEAARGWTVHFAAVRSDKCAADGSAEPKGVAVIVTKAGQTKETPVTLRLDNGRVPKLVCVTFKVKKVPGHACSTHLLASAQYTKKEAAKLADKKTSKAKRKAIKKRAKARAKRWRTTQATQVATATRGWAAAGDLTIVGGDLNATPGTAPLSQLYGPFAPGGKGAFREAEQIAKGNTARTGRATIAKANGSGKRKIDYLFVSSNRVARGKQGGLSVADTAHAQHHTLKLRVNVRQ